ncbi:radical SAM protein [Hymenobacter elongatus]|uniref:Radical SAM protein n=1 Tax=Hymenobacter elongatus TaxID=877208 RepID=A0A4Z0PNP2_9BACT|nr:radical SAM protein [Hymenobacter elongatus]TGE17799.1 radical SAM protein [Hymenobacter elongatus]
MVEPKVTLYSYLNRPVLDRVFFVPFWDCPYQCEFCCVDSLPGKPAGWPDSGEDLLFELLETMSRRYGRRMQLHFYGGEPMLRAGYVEHIARRVRDSPYVSKLVLYTTLRSKSPRQVLEILGSKRLEILVNPDTVNERVLAALQELKGVARLNLLPLTITTGRGAEHEPGYKQDFFQRYMPVGWPGRNCFAKVTGMLVNGPQRTVHTCCMPQSPIVGTFDSSAADIVAQYEAALATVPQALNASCRSSGGAHPCGVCDKFSGYQSQAGPGQNSYTVAEALALA